MITRKTCSVLNLPSFVLFSVQNATGNAEEEHDEIEETICIRPNMRHNVFPDVGKCLEAV